MGYSTRSGIAIHRVECPFLRRAHFDRCLPAHYVGYKTDTLSLQIELVFENRFGVLKDLADILFAMGISVDEIHTERPVADEIHASLLLVSSEEDYYLADRLMDRLRVSMPYFRNGRVISIG